MYIHIMINVRYFVLCLMTIQILDFKSIKSLTLTFKMSLSIIREMCHALFPRNIIYYKNDISNYLLEKKP